jgi:hypothetical protein
MTLADYQQCEMRGQVAFCPRHNVVRHIPDWNNPPPKTDAKDPEICLMSLYKEAYAYIKHHCNIRLKPQRSSVTQISPTEFVVFNNNPHQGRITCSDPETPHQRRIPVRKGGIIYIPAGCQASTDTHDMAASDAGFNTGDVDFTVAYQWPTDQPAITADIDFKLLKKIHRQPGNIISHKDDFSLDEAKADLDRISKHDFAGTWHGPAATGGGSLIFMALMAYCIYTCCRKERTTNPVNTPATTAPPPYLNIYGKDH